ncbi:small acid-soluble spore protein, H-type [Thermincola ferriacetica]|uniref:Small acid-soluble spore protein, H-type n=2 Tax=Thermincola TaxID=278993 RepID=D5XEG3_THEPJ|nr:MULTISPECIES: H-type small acid-soluble spore protein [Thermincola]ADG82034.1 small acid-soluble spore protein, H-type [Thermincola potens JR]KNZ71052.1 small acid-soluble spore protein, H-type [Thermincola ferriacetica]
MDYKRAEEIVNSPEMIDVRYNGAPVWIEGLNPEQQTAVISSDVFAEPVKTVPVRQLTEKH